MYATAANVAPADVYRIAKAWQWQTTATRLRALPLIRVRALAAPRSRSAMHAIDGVRVDEIVGGFDDHAISVGELRSRPIPSHRGRL